MNYLVLNFIGYTYYSTYNIYGYVYDPPFNNGQIHLSDIIFAVHGLFMVSVQIVLVLYYPRKDNQLKRSWMAFALLSIASIGAYALYNPVIEKVVLVMGLMKVAISFVKYVPQVYLNWSRKSTAGWSFENVLLDFTGGLLSFLQIPVDYYATGSKPKLDSNLNVAKFLLGFITVSFDIIFIVQHYCLYGRKTQRGTQGGETHDSTDRPNLTDKDEENYINLQDNFRPKHED